MKRVLAICAAAATVAVGLSLLNEAEPEVCARVSYRSGPKVWQVTGQAKSKQTE
jgi:hypothetical protein